MSDNLTTRIDAHLATSHPAHTKALRGVLSVCAAAEVMWSLAGRDGKPAVWTVDVREVIAEALDVEVGGVTADVAIPVIEEQKALLAVVAGLVPATAQQVAAALGALSVGLGQLADELAAADQRATLLSEDYATAYDKAFLAAGEGEERVTEKVREATARVATAQLRLDMEVAKLNVRSLKNAHKTLDRRIDVGRTTAATVRSEHRTIGYGGGS